MIELFYCEVLIDILYHTLYLGSRIIDGPHAR